MFGTILSQITTANGYSTNLGQSVTFGRPPEASEYGREAIYYFPVSKQITPENMRWEHRQQWEIIAVKFAADAETAIFQIEGDVWKALGVDSTINGKIISPAEGACEYEIDTAGKQAVKLTFRVEALSKTLLFAAD
jgi:hypothetical protein